ncbi:hypothetical protein M413DRAFT_343921 [Hebeloma cylindrosporum]|uniref:Uncharacterized protein n=1 Tax=Hebeloma cylindrosporum TaxID=76867 RepID=A0A0C2YX83_HEBCY|nr:hypothetical protein M413DRAFT_343921 [Hebeloma cylindrosporum h7]
MKRGHAEVMSGTTQPLKKAKTSSSEEASDDTIPVNVNGLPSTTNEQQHQDGWTKVEKRKKKKEVKKVDTGRSRDVRYAVYLTFRDQRTLFVHHVANHHHFHFVLPVCADNESEVHVFES